MIWLSLALAILVVFLFGRLHRRSGGTVSDGDTQGELLLLKTVCDAVQVGITVTDMAGRIIYVNPADAEMHGYDRDALEGRDVRVYSPSSLADPMTADQIAKMGRWRRESLNIRKDGRVFPVRLLSDVVRSHDGRPIAVITICEDITEERRVGERMTMLVRELDHRVKNTLNTVSALLERTAKNSNESLPDFMESIRGRLDALARVHHRMSGDGWRGMTMQELVGLTLSPYPAEDSLFIGGDSVNLPFNVATPLAMGLHELATNAVKHGALSVPDGKVRIEWRKVDGDELELVWEETGGPPVEEPSHYGFGLVLLTRGIPYETGGEAKLELDPSGARCVIRVPLGPPTAARSRPSESH